MPAEKPKSKRITQDVVLPILSALEQIATSYKTKGQFVGNSVAKQLEGYQQRDAKEESGRGEAIDRALRYKQIQNTESDRQAKATSDSAKAARESEFGEHTLALSEIPEDRRQAAAQKLLAKYDPEKYTSSMAYPKPSMETEIAKALAILQATEPVRQRYSLETDRIKRKREKEDIADKPLSGDAAKLVAAQQSVADNVPKLRGLIETNGARWVAAQYKAGNPQVTFLIDDLSDAKGRIRSGGAVNNDESAKFQKPFTSLSQILYDDQNAMLNALASLETESSNTAKSLGRPVTSQPSDGVRVIPGSTDDNVKANYKVGQRRTNNKGQTVEMQQDGTWKIIQ
jgi:hypothetical protein